MTALTTTTSSPANRPTSPALTPDLSALLDTAASPDAAGEIARSPVLLAEVKHALPALKAVAEHKAGEDGVRAVIGRRFALYPQPERDDGEWAGWWADYFDVLADVPLSCLEAAMRAFIARPTSQFMPKPGELRDLAFRTPSRTLQRYQRAKRALQIADDTPRPVYADDAPQGEAVDHQAEIRKMLAEYTAKAGARGPAFAARAPSTAGKPDAGGLTPQMRELIARRGPA